MKIYRLTSKLGDNTISILTLTDSDRDQQWLEHFKMDTRNNPHPFFKMEIEIFERISTNTIFPENPSTLSELGL